MLGPATNLITNLYLIPTPASLYYKGPIPNRMFLTDPDGLGSI